MSRKLFIGLLALALMSLEVDRPRAVVSGFSIDSKIPFHCGAYIGRIMTQLHNVVSEVVEDEAASVASETDDNENTKTKKKRRFMYMTPEQDEVLREKGEVQAKLMAHNLSPLRPNVVKGVGGSGGFGGGGTKKKKKKASKADKYLEQAKSHASVLASDGIVRIDHVLTKSLADQLRDYLVDLRARATEEIERGLIEDSQERFADVLLNQNRCDLKVPLGPPVVHEALLHLLAKSPLRSMIEHVFNSGNPSLPKGKEATLYELNCFMSNSGSRRQLVHSDNSCHETVPGVLSEDEPIMLTCFVALQDIDETMGPTWFLLGTHNREAHNQFYETVPASPWDNPDAPSAMEGDNKESATDRLLRTAPTAIGTLPKGSCAVFDPRILHCAGANTCPDPALTRALFYFSFKSPRIGSPGCPSTCGYGISDAELSLEELCQELAISVKAKKKKKKTEGSSVTGSGRLDAMAHFP